MSCTFALAKRCQYFTYQMHFWFGNAMQITSIKWDRIKTVKHILATSSLCAICKRSHTPISLNYFIEFTSFWHELQFLSSFCVDILVCRQIKCVYWNWGFGKLEPKFKVFIMSHDFVTCFVQKSSIVACQHFSSLVQYIPTR